MKTSRIIVILAVIAIGFGACDNNNASSDPCAGGHSFGNWTVYIPVTCSTAGEERLICLRDGCEHFDRRSIPPSHDWSNWIVTTPVGCFTDGEETRSCNRNCGIAPQTQIILATGHDWSNWTVTTPADCLTNGLETRSCNRNCGVAPETQIIPALGHNVNWTESAVWGMETGVCSRCALTASRMSNMVQINGGILFSHYQAINNTEIPAFRIGRYQVTQAQWEKVMGSNPSWFSVGGSGAALVTGMDTTRFPVESVSWFNALVFSNRLSKLAGLTPVYEIETAVGSDVWSSNPDDWGEVPTGSGHANFTRWNNARIIEGATGYRLPVQEQWEFAARAGSAGLFSRSITGIDVTPATIANYAWFDSNSGSRTHQVGTRAANYWGLRDMHGNVSEWTFSRGSLEHMRVLRGGNWFHSEAEVRSSTGIARSTNNNDSASGLRLVLP